MAVHAYKRVIVYSEWKNLELRKGVESSFVKALADDHIWGGEDIEFFPPIREYSDSEIVKRYGDNGIDAILEISQNGKEYSRVGRSESVRMGRISSGSSMSHNALTGLGVSISLVDAQTGDLIYKAQVSNSTSASSNNTDAFLDMIQAAAKEVADDLVKKKLVETR